MSPVPLDLPDPPGSTGAPLPPRPEPLGPALTGACLRLADAAARVRGIAAGLTNAATASGWRSVAAESCRARLAAAAADVLGAAALLDLAAEAFHEHAVTAARRAAAAMDLWDAAARAAETVVAGAVTTLAGVAEAAAAAGAAGAADLAGVGR